MNCWGKENNFGIVDWRDSPFTRKRNSDHSTTSKSCSKPSWNATKKMEKYEEEKGEKLKGMAE
jgi:hypothetical protein